LSSTDAGLSERLPPRAVLAALALALVAATIVALLLQPSQREIERALDGGGAAGPAIFAGTYALLTVAFFPGAVLTLAAGALYGVAGGTAVSMVGATLGALGAFLIARRSAHSAVERAGGERYGALVDRLRGRGLFALLALRLLPVVPFNALNYAAGASSIGLVITRSRRCSASLPARSPTRRSVRASTIRPHRSSSAPQSSPSGSRSRHGRFRNAPVSPPRSGLIRSRRQRPRPRIRVGGSRGRSPSSWSSSAHSPPSPCWDCFIELARRELADRASGAR